MKNIAIYLPSRSQNVFDDLDNEGCAAREQVADFLAYGFSRDGYAVHVFTNQEYPVHSPELEGGGSVHYVHHEIAASMFANYIWEALITFDYPTVTTLENIKDSVKRIIVAQNYFEIPTDAQVDEEHLDMVDTWVFPSEFALNACCEANGIDPSKGVVINYAADPRFFSHKAFIEGELPPSLKPKRFIYANQAETGLAQLLRVWPKIRDHFPNSTLTVATPVDEFVEHIVWSHSIQSELALDIRDLIGQDGVRYIGRQGRAALAREMTNSDFLLFPAEPLLPSELGSLPLIQAASTGCMPVFAETDALEELYSEMCCGYTGDFVEALIDAIKKPVKIVIPDNRLPYPIMQQWMAVIDNVDAETEADFSYAR